jgi:tungstate transport system ATP-binding protein
VKLVVSNISKSYNGNTVLKGCSFSFDSNNTYVLMGPNGSGKSTFLRICSLLEKPDNGEVNYFSEKTILKRDNELMRRITLVLPMVGVFNTTVFKNVAYGLKVRKTNRNNIEERVINALEFVGLVNKRGQNALTLSSGEIQRLGIARAMVIEPEIIFLDEPTASVDIKNIEIIEEIIMKMKEQSGATIILTTHDTSQAKRLAEKTLYIQGGKLDT